MLVQQHVSGDAFTDGQQLVTRESALDGFHKFLRQRNILQAEVKAVGHRLEGGRLLQPVFILSIVIKFGLSIEVIASYNIVI